MTNQTRRLPLFAALAAFLLYVCTLGNGVTRDSLLLTAHLAGWTEVPLVGQPLLWVITLPLRLLPAGCLWLAVKLLAALLASAILGLLVRTVQLLPWDRTWDKVNPWFCALPAVLAWVICGLEFSFWQAATATCGELLDLLLLAVAVWLLLEYNVRRNVRWLAVAAVVWGIGMAENWVMVLTFPLFIIGVIWLERLRLLDGKFALRLGLLILAGYSIYILSPMVNGLAPHSPWTLKQSWIVSLHQSKQCVQALYYEFWRNHRFLGLGVLVTYLVPTLPLLVRMPDEATWNKSGAERFQFYLYRGLRVALILVCFWLALDPRPAARQMIARELHQDFGGGQYTLLSFDYLNALGLAFLLGNLLLITQFASRDPNRSRGRSAWPRLAGSLVAGVVLLMAVALLARNAPAIWHTNVHSLEQFGATAVKSLPAGPGVMLCDNPDESVLFRAALSRRRSDWMVVMTPQLPNVQYRGQLERQHPAGWLTKSNQHALQPVEVLRLLDGVARSNHLYYLHPGCNQVFERFYPVPAGLIYELKPRGKDPLTVPPLTDPAREANEQFWSRLWDRELSALTPPPASPMSRQLARYGLTAAPRDQDRLVAGWYALPLQAWGVTLQQAGHLREAQTRFQQVLQICSNNVAARCSLVCNTNLQAGTPMGLADASKLVSELGNANRLGGIIATFGPFDWPAFNYLWGCLLFDRGLPVQAVEQLERARVLAPTTPAPEMTLAEIYNRLQMPERSRPLITHLRQMVTNLPAATGNSLELSLAMLDSYAWLLETNVSSAREVLQSVVRDHPDDPQVASRVTAAYLAINDMTNALQLVESRLAKSPDDIPNLNIKATILIHSGRAAEAMPVLDHLLTLTNLSAARLNRAFGRIALKDFAPAQTDFQELAANTNLVAPVNLGLALVAEHDADTNAARRYVGLCLANTSAGSAMWQQAHNVLQRLEPENTNKPAAP